MSLRDQVRSGISKRTDFPLQPGKAALLVIDIQKYLSSQPVESYLNKVALPKTILNLKKLTQAFRKIRDRDNDSDSNGYTSVGCEVIFTYLQCLTKDGRDISLDYKLSGQFLANIPRVGCSPEDLFLRSCYPDIPTNDSNSKGDILIPKTSCSVFRSTNIDYVLRNLGIEQLVITGQMTDQCVESAVRDAADSGYFVTVVQDACAAGSQENHEKGLKSMEGFCRLMDTDQILKELQIMERKVVLHQQIAESKRPNTGQNHELLTLPRKMKFQGSVIVDANCAYPQTKCVGCTRKVRTYCRCSPGRVRCQECYARHLIDVESGCL